MRRETSRVRRTKGFPMVETPRESWPSASQEASETLDVARETASRLPVRLSFLLAITGGVIVFYLCFAGIGGLLIPSQIAAIDPTHKVADLGVIATVTALAAFIVGPISGALSDRTTTRFGRRRPWIFGGTVGSALALALLIRADSILLLGLGVMLYQAFANVALAALNALVPDLVPERQRGTASGLIGLGLPIGSIAAAILVGGLTKIPQTAYLVMLIITLIFLFSFSLLVHERPIDRETVPPFRLTEFFKGFWINPRQHPDFAWAFAVRFIPILGFYVGNAYLFYYLQDAVQYQRVFPGQTALQGAAIITAVETGALTLSILLGGVLSDRFQRRKPFVIISVTFLAVGLLLYGFVQVWTVVLIACVILGLAMGSYLAVDLALTTLVLPTAEAHGKDLGIMGIAFTLPGSFAPGISGFILLAFQGAGPHTSYAVLFTLAAFLTLVGIPAVLQIKGVR